MSDSSASGLAGSRLHSTSPGISSSEGHADPAEGSGTAQNGRETSQNPAARTKPGNAGLGRTSAGSLGTRPRSSLSPSRASDFMTCPLLYRFRTIDRLPEKPSVAAVRGTLVHSVLEQLFDEPSQQRSPKSAVQLLEPAWAAMTLHDPSLSSLLFGPEDNWQKHLEGTSLRESDPAAEAKFIGEAEKLVETYFRLENPRILEPQQREAAVSFELESGLTLRGIIDRIDEAPGGEIRIVDYKTGRSPRAGWEDKALFQMRFYGLIIWRMTQRLPARLQLIYLGNQEILAIDPTESQLKSTQAKVEALWRAIEQSRSEKRWQPKSSRLCDWCSFQNLCPEWGGTPPHLPIK